MTDSTSYRSLGVSSAKEDVVAAARLQGEGMFPGAFCKLVADSLTGDDRFCLALHADGAGTKAIVAYLLFREQGDPGVFASLAQDSLVMNLDDLICVGATGPFALTNTIGRHREMIPSAAIEAVIGGYEACARALGEQGVEVALCGGETADLGDLVRTLVVDASMVCRLPRQRVIDGSAVASGDRIVGLASAGRVPWEAVDNSGIGSNGLTLARHALLKSDYRRAYPEASAPELEDELAYRGPFALSDRPEGLGMTVGEALLSPTMSAAPVVIEALERLGDAVHAVVHCTGGGQTKCLRLPAPVRYVKDALFPVPPLFELIRQAAGLPWAEMYQVFNMGHRMELFVDAAAADELVALSQERGLEAKVVGRCEPSSDGPRLLVEGQEGTSEFGRS